MHLSTTLLPAVLLLLAPATSIPAPSPQMREPFQCPNGPTCQSELMTMSCQNGNLVCMLGLMVQIPVGKCTDCTGSMCARRSDDYPAELKTRREVVERDVVARSVVEREVVERNIVEKGIVRRQDRCQAQWECACVAFDGKGYYTRGLGKQCPVMEGAYEVCDSQTGFLCIFGCRSELLKGFTNEKCDALFPGTRAVCKSY
ncbi:hypothetical protein QBC34DRAFT_457451 [Podospora aff. communis PSN243]|uniref:Uncharacterized protein n=1 Tax=Podospora aff. communis PSN243 TaxID=3040156 RepID=A0AAV9FZ12_9PEZI|nr:hypothetical protein QBC34DRAFT_457451 [Podospora aff. communis PSN243]